jgi:hypothetical protein
MTLIRHLLMIGLVQSLALITLVRPALAQEDMAQPLVTYDEVKPAMDITAGDGARVAEIIIVVKDAAKSARRFSDMFGCGWTFYDYRPVVRAIHGKPSSGESYLKLALAACGGRNLRLVQPVSGVSAYSEFLEKVGEGFFGISIGVRADFDQSVKALTAAGVSVQMISDDGNGLKTAVLDSSADLGLRVEFTGPGATTPPSLKRTGAYSTTKAPIVDLSEPLGSGGRYIGQLGLVVDDIHRVSRRYAELLGLRYWRFTSILTAAMSNRGIPISATDMPSTKVGWGATFLGDVQIELLDPVPGLPGGPHRNFLDKHWPSNGFQHVMLLPGWPADHREIFTNLFKNGAVNYMEYSMNPGPTDGYYVELPDVGNIIVEWNIQP